MRKYLWLLAMIVPLATALAAAWIHSPHANDPTGPFDAPRRAVQEGVVFGGVILGWICLGRQRFGPQILKWVLMGMYPFVMLLASAIIDIMINGILIEGF